jgi:hypothetical protein
VTRGAIAAPIAASATPAAASALAPVTAFVLACVDDLGAFRRLVISLVVARLIAVNRDHAGSLGDGTRRGRFAPARFTAPTSAPPPPAPAPAARSGLTARFVDRCMVVVERLDLLDVAFVRFGFGLDFRHLGSLERRFFLFRLLNRGRGDLLGNGAGLLDGVRLLAAFDQERLLAGHTRIGIDRDCDLEALLEIAQMRAFVVEQIEGDVALRADHLIVGRAAQERFFDHAQQLECNRGDRANVTGTAAKGAFVGRAFQHARPNSLARHFHQAEMRDAADLDACPVVLERVLETALDRAVVALLIHVDEIDHDEASEVAQP